MGANYMNLNHVCNRLRNRTRCDRPAGFRHRHERDRTQSIDSFAIRSFRRVKPVRITRPKLESFRIKICGFRQSSPTFSVFNAATMTRTLDWPPGGVAGRK
jgi:hypothetical protein